MVCGGGVTTPVDGVMVLVISGLSLSVVKDTVEAMVDEVVPNVGISESKYGKGGGDTLCLLGEGGGGG